MTFSLSALKGDSSPLDLLRRILDPREKLPGTLPEDYGLPNRERLNEIITQSWSRLQKHWAEFRAATEALPISEPGKEAWQVGTKPGLSPDLVFLDDPGAAQR